MKEQWLTMSEDDTFEEDGNIGQIGNMTVKDFMSKIWRIIIQQIRINRKISMGGIEEYEG